MNVAVPLLLALRGVTRRLWAVLLPLVAVPLLYAGLRRGWWGAGVGDGWQYAAAVVTLVGIVGSIVGVLVGRFLAGILRHFGFAAFAG